ncbi:MAG: DNA replication protein [Alphaproteobacteria bacterium]|nr:MAG: DNA replication protein [Alphaproteobacteria bacterium]
MPSVQIPFDIPVREAFEAEDYLVTSSNEAAVKWVDCWPEWPNSHCTILYGAAGCGKTHLSHVWQQKSGAKRMAMEDIDVTNLHGLPNCLIIEAVDQIVSRPNMQEPLFHLYNWQKENEGSLLLTATQHPKYWPAALPDLRSRLLASMAIEIGPPDDELLAAVIVKQFLDRQINVPMDVIAYLLLRIERSFEAARDIVRRIDSLSLSRKRKITIPLVRDLLD